MPELLSAPLSAKAQLTVPKKVRELLGLRNKGDMVGFVIDEQTHRVLLTRVDLVPAEEPYTEQELRKLLRLAKEPGGKVFRSADAFLKHLRSL